MTKGDDGRPTRHEPEMASDRRHSVVATRNPKLSARSEGISTSREAERSQAGIAFHAPPRITRALWNFDMQLLIALPYRGVCLYQPRWWDYRLRIFPMGQRPFQGSKRYSREKISGNMTADQGSLPDEAKPLAA
jgi:hypothetical protein